MHEREGVKIGGRPVFAKILRASIHLSIAGLIVKFIATGKEFVLAAVFGRTDAMDAYLLAFLLPNLFINLIAESMNQALLPTYIRVRMQEGKEAAQKLFTNATLALVALLALITALLAVGLHLLLPLLAPHFSAAKLQMAWQLGLIMMPMMIFIGIASNSAAVLNTLDRFTWPSLAQAFIPICIVAGALAFGRSFGITAIAYATLIGAALYALSMVVSLHLHGVYFHLRWTSGAFGTGEVFRQYVQVLLSALVANAGLLADQTMTMLLPAGSLSALVYAGRFVAVPMSLLAGVISTAIMPYFSRLIAQRDWRACRKSMRQWSWLMAAASVLPAAVLILFAKQIIRIAFEHGAFKSADTAAVGPILMMYAIQIPFYVVSRVQYRFIIAMRRTDIAFYCGTVNLALDVVLNIVLMRYWGVAGIALSTSLWTVFTFFFLVYWAYRLLRNVEKQEAAA
jgi:putative peptidoglycan lipid II flippase